MKGKTGQQIFFKDRKQIRYLLLLRVSECLEKKTGEVQSGMQGKQPHKMSGKWKKGGWVQGK